MGNRFRHAAIVGKFQAQGMRALLEEIAQFLLSRGLEVSMERATANNTGMAAEYGALTPAEMGQQCDLAVVVGGDGTMLGIARELARHNIPLVGINQGRLGFITDITVAQFREALAPMLDGDYEEEHRSMLGGGVWRDGRPIFESMSLNDVVVSRGATASMVELRIHIGEEFVANMRADGLIIASPTGSTAYALSAGGPILHPGIAGWVLVPIASHTLSNRPIVLPDAAEITVEIVAGRDASANFDMHSLTSLLHGDEVRVQRSAHKVRFLHPRGWSYYATLRRKLRWYEGV
ncbi:NAD kinase [Aquincola tertiaricarbonis]|uniref:NAD kinase n=1 Tax=Aquincola tertiaricarbonis TaxID=391953 RepID=A0ABY4SC63_AQUTE|nr:NAD kinase [Aquincola tertiaricarbonis]URI10594.1 NAD kinase [Aquincola tertiaricarbonis]